MSEGANFIHRWCLQRAELFIIHGGRELGPTVQYMYDLYKSKPVRPRPPVALQSGV